MARFIEIKNARVNNLKGVNVQIPHNQLVVITGLSGSGKSSLAFDTLYAEGQRRYVESLSAYVRQFLGRMNKPEVDSINGIPPAIAIEQKVNIRNPHSTVGSSTEIYDYIRLLYARIGKTYSPATGKLVKQDTVDSVADFVMNFPEKSRIILLSPIVVPKDRILVQHLEVLLQQGFSRLEFHDEYLAIHDIIDQETEISLPLSLVIDRLEVSSTQEFRNRLSDSLETAFFEGNGSCQVDLLGEKRIERYKFSKEFESEGVSFETPTEQFFNFNNPLGACPTCGGFGKIIGIDEDLVIPDKTLSVYQDAVACWKGEVMGEWKLELIQNADKFQFPLHKPYQDLTEEQKNILWNGNTYFEGINTFFEYVKEQQYKIQYRVLLARYRGKTLCPDCHGTRLRKEVQWIKVGGLPITELVKMPVSKLSSFFDSLELEDADRLVAKRLLTEIKNRIRFLVEVGLGYLQLDRPSNTLSGGESQRINLATSLGSSLVGSLYILDEPSVGLHSRDTALLIKILRELQSLGNTVIVVEHDEEMIRSADYIVDIGPHAGRLGGEVVYQGSYSDLIHAEELKNSHTYCYLTGKEQIEMPVLRRRSPNFIEVLDAHVNNLKHVNVQFPLNVMTVVTGVSGSGKSSLVRNVLYELLRKYFELNDKKQEKLKGSLHLISAVEFVDQNPIGKSSRSNPATYLKAYDEIRKLFSEQPLAKQLGFSAAHFSFNIDGGRCEECQGEGSITVEMQFMADIQIECESCHGKRFKQEVLEVQYCGKSIFEILEMTVNQSIEFLGETKGSTERRIVKRLKPLQDVGLGYIKIGQSSSSLSGGESQRVKLASFLANEKQEPTFFIFDEPTVGLHFHDIKVLLKAFNQLIEKGHTVLIIEHNLEVVKCADYLIDMGPEGGDAGGELVYAGSPEGLIACEKGYTGKYLKGKM